MAITAIQYNSFSDIDDAMHLDASDLICLSEIQELLEAHGKEQRFSIGLIHKHFDLLDNEVLLETCDPVRRTLKCQPVDRSVLGSGKVVATSWTKDLGIERGCEKVCPTGDGDRHYGYSDHVEDGE
jgi:hypothetical protein